MSVRARFETKGFEAYLEAIARAGEDVDAAAAEALQAGGEILLAGMQKRVPKDTGNLHDNLTIEGPHQDANYHYVIIGLAKSADAKTARYGNAQEYGTSSMAAHPFVRPTLESDISKARRAMRDVFKSKGVL